MLETLSHLNWAMVATFAIPIPTTFLASWCERHTTLLQRPDLGIIDEHVYVMAGLRAEHKAFREDNTLRRLFRAWPRTPAAPAHECCADLERGRVEPLRHGAVRVTCSVAGCGRTMVIGRDLASSFFVEGVL